MDSFQSVAHQRNFNGFEIKILTWNSSNMTTFFEMGVMGHVKSKNVIKTNSVFQGEHS